MIFHSFLAKSWPERCLAVDWCFGKVPNGFWVASHILNVFGNAFWPRFGQKTPNFHFGNLFYRHVNINPIITSLTTIDNNTLDDNR